MLVENLLWRNTKVNLRLRKDLVVIFLRNFVQASVAEEYKMTDTKYECVLLDFTPIESAIYEDMQTFKSRRPRAKLCCKLDANWGENLTEIRQYFIQKKTTDINTDETVSHTLQKRLIECKDLLASKISSGWEVYEARKFINEFPTKIDEVKKRIATHNKIKDQLKAYVSTKYRKIKSLFFCRIRKSN